MVAGDHVVQDGQFIPLLGLIQPLQITIAILRELEEEFPFMASMSDMPDITWNVMSFCSCHRLLGNQSFCPQKIHHRPVSEGHFGTILSNISYLSWPDPTIDKVR